jgi:hypothetical protein
MLYRPRSFLIPFPPPRWHTSPTLGGLGLIMAGWGLPLALSATLRMPACRAHVLLLSWGTAPNAAALAAGPTVTRLTTLEHREGGGQSSTADERDRCRHTGPGALQLCAARASRQHEGPCQRHTARRGRCQHSEHDPTARGKRRLQRQQSLVAAMIALVAKWRAPTRSLPRDVNVAAGSSCHVTRAC